MSRLAILVPEGSREGGNRGGIGNNACDGCWCIERKVFQHHCAQTNGEGNGVFDEYILRGVWKCGTHDTQRRRDNRKKETHETLCFHFVGSHY